MEGRHKVPVPLAQPVGVTAAAEYLLHRLHCDGWHVACHHEHLLVIHLTRGGLGHYALCCECSQPAERGVYHESLVSSLAIVPLACEHDLSPEEVADLRAGLAELGSGAHVPGVSPKAAETLPHRG